MFSACNFGKLFFSLLIILKAILIDQLYFSFFPLVSMQLSWAAGGAPVCAGQQPAEGGSLLPPQSPARGLLEEH